MRWVFILLLMCNGIYFVWHGYMQPDAAEVLVLPEVTGAPQGERLVLLSEAMPEQKSEPEKALEENVPPVSHRPVCWMFGPFVDVVSAKQVVTRLEAMDIKLQLMEFEVQGKPDYWVHIPPLASRKLAIKLLRELQSKKIDSFLITEGELENGISLGFFTEQPRAEAIHKQRQQQGFNAVIKVVPRIHKENWAIYSVADYGDFSDSLWERVKEGNSGLQRRKNYCDKIASSDQLD